MKTAIKINHVKNHTDLHCQYSGQTNPQSTYIWLDPRGDEPEMGADYNAEIGNTVPTDVYHGLVIRYPLPGILSAQSTNNLMEHLLPLMERVVAGFSEDLDRYNSNYIGTLSEDAQAAKSEIDREIETWIDDEDYLKIWAASDWLESETNVDLGITAATTDDELDAIAERIRAAAIGDADIIDGLDSHLRYRRDAGEDR